jgi:hypothetical protein
MTTGGESHGLLTGSCILCSAVLGQVAVTSQKRRPGKRRHKNVIPMVVNGGEMRMKRE